MKSKRCALARWVMATALSAALLACGPKGPGGEAVMNDQAPVRLAPGQKEERHLTKKETHSYLLRLEAGDYVRVAAEQRGVDLALRLSSPSGERIAEIDSPTGTLGAERV